MSQAVSLDHVGVVGGDLDALATTFEALGFCLTPLARHAGGRTGNRCVMLHEGYVELLATVDGGVSATLARFLAHHAGAHLLALGMADEDAVLARLQRAGLDVAEASETDRSVDDADPAGPRARFVLITPPDRPEGRFHLVRHLAPEALWQPRFLDHPNRAVALVEAILISAVPAETAAALSRLAGRPVVPDPVGGYALDLPQGRVRVLPEEAAAALLPGMTVPPAPCIAGLTLQTDDCNATLLARLATRAVSHRIEGAVVLVEAGGVALRFVGSPEGAGVRRARRMDWYQLTIEMPLSERVAVPPDAACGPAGPPALAGTAACCRPAR